MEIRNGIIENEEKISQASSEKIRHRIIENIFAKYPFIKNFKVIKYINTGDYDFSYDITF